jgi:hypothetical protein
VGCGDRLPGPRRPGSIGEDPDRLVPLRPDGGRAGIADRQRGHERDRLRAGEDEIEAGPAARPHVSKQRPAAAVPSGQHGLQVAGRDRTGERQRLTAAAQPAADRAAVEVVVGLPGADGAHHEHRVTAVERRRTHRK